MTRGTGARTLVVYSTIDGHTQLICRRLKEQLEEAGHAVTLASLDGDARIDPKGFAKVVIGASIRYGKHRPNVYRFVRKHRAALDGVPSAFFSVDLVSRKRGKDTPDGNPYVREFRRRTRWQPRQVGVFAGKLDYRRYGPLDRNIIRFIMLLTKGPTDPSACVEFTDWDAVRRFGERLAAM